MTHDPDGPVHPAEVQLAPTFDHASCLGFNLRDEERLDRMRPGSNRTVESFADRAASKLYLVDVESAKPLSPLGAFVEATKDRPAARHAWIERARRITDEQLRGIIAAVPRERMSIPARDFALAHLRVNRARIGALEPQ
ncbi:hypothetical protein PHYC_00990 [Phycisphaerales bacterium]|nr:hypothetical protein PHYC_00990 [Phycisphaerales bacterium]